ncbi:hypothetical protein [Kitasatospora sp. NBC_01302]|uniref:hypothetical protein n=1 Tax=Kitasatospora sp. NBC_01302 TaxID=2903575 RepID=UPI002E0ED8CC|nr:hypothetical protein OG294_27685 [Kitasatospora sp. NBC_01302]
MNHTTDPGITTAPELLRVALGDADANQLIGPAFRRATLVTDAQAVHEAIEIAEKLHTLGFTPDDQQHLVDCVTAPNPAQALTDWLTVETRPYMRRGLAAALLTTLEER